VDVVVTDNNHKPVHGLKPSDFTLAEDNVPQAVNHFEEHNSITAAEAAALPPPPVLPVGIFTNESPAPPGGAVNLLLLDSLNTPMADQARVYQQLLKFLQQATPGTRIAIFGLTSHLVILQGFTTDFSLMKAVVAGSLAHGSHLLDDQTGGSGTSKSNADNLEDTANNLNISNPNVVEVVANMRQLEAQQKSYQLQQRAQFTLDAMSQIARYLAAIPGRKNLIWFSGSFPINILPDVSGDLARPFAVVETSADQYRDTANLLGRSQVAVYPIDARGVFTSPIFNASSTRKYGADPKRVNKDAFDLFTDTTQTHGTMQNMAEATGGQAYINTNGLAQAALSAIDDGSNFYTLTYTPRTPARNGDFRKIKVQVDQHGLTLAYRRGYYADDPAKMGPVPETASQNALHMAMMRGAPAPTQIVMKVGVVPIPATRPEEKPAPGNVPAPGTHGPYRRYSVNYAVEPSDVAFLPTADGKVHADLQFLIAVFDAYGAVVNTVSTPIHLMLSTADEMKQAIAHGVYHLEISAPAKGEYFLRIAAHDLNRDTFGAVEVTTSAVKNVLPRATQPPPAPLEPNPKLE
jgi:VWFA-related protein